MKKKGKGGDQNQKSKAKQQQHRRPIIPFQKGDRVLLVGEGELRIFFFPRSPATLNPLPSRLWRITYMD